MGVTSPHTTASVAYGVLPVLCLFLAGPPHAQTDILCGPWTRENRELPIDEMTSRTEADPAPGFLCKGEITFNGRF